MKKYRCTGVTMGDKDYYYKAGVINESQINCLGEWKGEILLSLDDWIMI